MFLTILGQVDRFTKLLLQTVRSLVLEKESYWAKMVYFYSNCSLSLCFSCETPIVHQIGIGHMKHSPFFKLNLTKISLIAYSRIFSEYVPEIFLLVKKGFTVTSSDRISPSQGLKIIEKRQITFT